MSKTTTYEQLRIEAVEAGISLSEICKRAGVKRQTVQKWRGKEPHTIVVLNKLRAEITKAKGEKTTATV